MIERSAMCCPLVATVESLRALVRPLGQATGSRCWGIPSIEDLSFRIKWSVLHGHSGNGTGVHETDDNRGSIIQERSLSNNAPGSKSGCISAPKSTVSVVFLDFGGGACQGTKFCPMVS